MGWKVIHLSNKVINILEDEPRGRLLELGTGGGNLAKQAKDKGFEVVAQDINKDNFRYKDEIEFIQGDLNQGLHFDDRSFDYTVILETIEHLQNPYFVLSEINRILKVGGILVLSTPNILNLKSRFRFLFEGTYDYFREPPLEVFKHKFINVHIFAYKYPELEYILFDTNFEVEGVFTSFFEPQAKLLSLICLPIMQLRAYFKCRRVKKKSNMDYNRIFKIILSPELLYGRHLIIKARKRNKALPRIFKIPQKSM